MSTDIDFVNQQHDITISYDLCEEEFRRQGSYTSRHPPLDSIIPTLPAIDPELLSRLQTRFTPDEWCPTPYLKDVNPQATVAEKMYLDRKNPHPRDQRIVFVDEPHKYFIDGNCEYIMSVTALKGAFFPKFDDKKVASSILNGKTFQKTCHRPSHKYHGCTTVSDILERWSLWRDQGTALHRTIELCENQMPYSVDPCNQSCFQQYQVLFSDPNWVRWTVFRVEYSVFDEETLIAGQIDYLGLMDPKGKVVIIDWKRSASIPDCFWRGSEATYGYGACQEVKNLKYYHYCLQLNLYKYMLEKHYGLYVSQMFLVQMHPNRAKYGLPAVFLCDNLQKEVRGMMATRKVALQKMIAEDLARGYNGRPK